MRAMLAFLLLSTGLTSLADEAWVVVTLDRIEFAGNLVEWPRFKGNPINFVAVVATGNTHRKLAWPAAGWYTIADEGAELVQETESIPLFALPASEMGDRLGIAIQFLGNTEFDWDHRYIPEVLADLEGTLRRRLAAPIPALAGAGDTGAGGAAEAYRHYAVFVPYIRTFGPDAWAGNDVHTYTAQVMSEHDVIRFRYSIRRVFLPEGLRARVRLEGVKTVENVDSLNGEIFVISRTISGFIPTGRPIQHILRIPASGHYSMGDGDEKILSAVLFEGEVRPFLYVEVMVWDEDNPEIKDQHDLLGGFFGLWLPWRLSNLPGGAKRLVVPKSTPDGEVLIHLRLELLG
ncbi:MAG: hypothetical protein GXO72_01450 [Caldiserica bacterium]|nr:hypothetical protein [Caldisericota bacterium]